MTLVQRLFQPSNLVCDRLGITDEHERGMMRMFVNMCLLSAVCVVGFVAAWMLLS